MKNYFDVLNIHPYCKNENGSYKGLAIGVPQQIRDKASAVRSKMAEFNDENKPIIYTEIGWSTYQAEKSSGVYPVSDELQAKYLARVYMHSIADDIKQVYWYAFQDEGIDDSQMEENFGIVDWYGKAKPAYYSYYTLLHILKDADYLGELDAISFPVYGYKY